MKTDSIFHTDSIIHIIEGIELDKLKINDLTILDFALWELLLPIALPLLAPYIVDLVKKVIKHIRICSYNKLKFCNEESDQRFISVVNNSMLKENFFEVDTIDLERHFIIPFPGSKKEELVNNDFLVVFNSNRNKELRKNLYDYISRYYATDGILPEYNTNIDDFINRIAEKTSNNFISQIKAQKVRFNKNLFGVYDVQKTKDKCKVYVYQSDYFTFKCLTNIFNALKEIKPKEKLPYTEDIIKIKEMRPMLNSVGVGGFVIMDRGNGDEIVVALRGTNCDSGGYWHFTYDETFTSDDKNNVYSFEECLSRALTEELGILKEEQKICIPLNQMIMTDVGIIHTSGNDNRFEFEVLSYVRVCFSDKYRFSDFLRGYRFAKDAELETRCLDFVPISGIDNFIKNKNMSPEAKALMVKIKYIHMKKVLDSDKNGYKTILEQSK